MQKLALVLLLPLAACSSFGWDGRGGNLTEDQKKRGIRDVASLSNEMHETESFFRSVRRRSDGRNNAFGRDMQSITDFIDRHFWNYDANDPSVNYPSNTTKFEHIGRFGLNTATSLPVVDELTNR